MYGRFNALDDSTDDFGGLGGDFIAYAQAASAVSTAAAVQTPASPAIVAGPVAATTSTSNSVLSDLVAHETNGFLLYGGALAVLKDALAQTMTPALFAQLQSAAQSINVAGGVATTLYVQQLFDDVTLGNSANAYWNGGAASGTALGDLSASSTTAQLRELIGKWFLGTDLPGDGGSPGAGNSGISYKTYTLPLFATGGPEITDVNQGQLGDCWFLAAVGETALLDPSLIENMLLQHGNGTYKVEFWVNGKADFVTVNGALPTYTNGDMQYDGSRMAYASSTTSLWVPLLEKALAQLAEQSSVVTGEEYAGGQDQYFDLTSGGGEGITLLTGQNTATYAIAGASATALLGQMHNALAAGQDVLLGTSDQAVGGDLVADHMFAVTGVNVAAGTVDLYNPWGANGAGDGKAASFTISASALAADKADFYAALGVAKAA